jgi:hypothetical protein
VVEGDEPPDPTEEFDVVPVWHDSGDDSTGESEIVSDPPDHDHDGDRDEGGRDGDGRDGDDRNGAASTPRLYDGGDDVAPGPGAAVPIVEADDDITPTDAPAPRRRRLAGLARFVLALGVAAVLILGFAILAAWARSGYFVAFDDDGQVVIYQGREDSVLWFDPTREAFGPFRDELDDDKIAIVEEQPNFESQASAERFVSERLTPTTTEPDA